MKLYFYIMKELYDSKPFLEVDECEVMETQKRYYAVDKFPKDVYATYVDKSKIGNILGQYASNVVVLTEQNEKMAKEIFVKMYENELKFTKKRYEKAKAEFEAVMKMEVGKNEK